MVTWPALRRWMAPLERRLRLLVLRGAITRVDDGGAAQEIQGAFLGGDPSEGIPVAQPYGFATRPKVGAEAVVLNVGGRQGEGIVVLCEDRRYRLQGLQEGAVALYTDEGDRILLGRNGQITIQAGTAVTIQAGTVTITGDLGVDGDIEGAEVSDAGGSLAEVRADLAQLRAEYDVHVHPDPVTGVTGPAEAP